MTTTHSIAHQHLTAAVDDDHMELGTSPQPQMDDIDFDLVDEDDREHSVADNSMIDDTTEHYIHDQEQYLIQADNSTVAQDDFMWEGQDGGDIHEATFDFVEDAEMVPGEPATETLHHDHAETYVEESLEDPSYTTVGDTTIVIQESIGYEHRKQDDELLEVELVDEDLEEEEDTNLHQPITSTDSDQQPQIDTTPDEEFREDSTPEDIEAEPNPNETSVTVLGEDDEATASDEQQPETYEYEQHDAEAAQFQEAREGRQASEEIPTAALPRQGSHRQPSPEVASSDAAKEHRFSQHDNASHPHPITVHFSDKVYFLFPLIDPNDATPVLVANVTLAIKPLDDLFDALRQCPVVQEMLEQHEELIINFPTLGLQVCQDSRYASSTSLERILDIYMTFCQNEGLGDIAPLECQLTQRTCFTAQLAYLATQARDEKKTYTEIHNEHVLYDEGTSAEEPVETDHADTTTYYGTADVLQDNQDRAVSPEIAESVYDPVTHVDEQIHDPPLDDHLQTQSLDTTTDNSQYYSYEDQQRPGMEELTDPDPSFSNVETVPDGEQVEGPDLTDAAGNAGHSSPTVRGDHTEPTHQHEAVYTDNAENAFDQENDYGHSALDEDEDLFADDDPENQYDQPDESNENHAFAEHSINADQVAPLGAEDELAFSDDDDEDTSAPAPVTPSKATNGKRKLLEEDDELEIDLSTPEPKRSRAS